VNPLDIDIPDRDQCRKLQADMGMMPHIVEHSRMVARVADLLADLLLPLHPGLNPDLIHAAAILHDITKTRSFTTGEKHAETGGQLLTDLGFPEVGNVIRQHVVLDRYPDDGAVTEAEIVNYSDKRVLHDTVVPLERRLAYILERYGTAPEIRSRIEVVMRNSLALERRLFQGLSIAPDQVRP
jgi:putative nucleotidyltransferase with HDIG domain